MIHAGIVDSGVDGPARDRVIAARDFPPAETGDNARPYMPRDACGHGSQVGAILAGVAGIELLDARVMFDAPTCSTLQLAAAIEWLCDMQVRVINLSLGLREDRAPLREACARATAQGVLLVAATPARGAPVYPAAYRGVLRATGDARCARGEISWLGTAQADFGGYVRNIDGAPGGASIGCAHVCARAAQWLARHPGAANDELLEALRGAAAHRGPERRRR